MDKLKDKKWLYNLALIIVGAYFLIVFHINEGFPPCPPINNDNWVFLFLGIVFILLPIAKRIKFGQFLEIDKEIKNVRESVSDFKDEIRSTVSVLSSTVNTISMATNQVTVNIPSARELKESGHGIENLINDSEIKEEKIRNDLVLDDEDTIISLAKVRIRLEQLLRSILGKRLSSSDIINKKLKYLSIIKLFDEIAKEKRALTPVRRPLEEVIQVCNAAMHGQRIPYAEASAAIELGTSLIAALEDLCNDGFFDAQQDNQADGK